MLGRGGERERDRYRKLDRGPLDAREPGEVGEQATMFFLDPSGNALELKAFADMSRLFAK